MRDKSTRISTYGLHTDEEGGESLPAGQREQLPADARENVPGTQLLQDVEPTRDDVPATHGTHVTDTPPTELVPAGQALQVWAPVAIPNPGALNEKRVCLVLVFF